MNSPLVYEPRTYRDSCRNDGLETFKVAVETSDLYVKAHSILEQETEALVREYRAQIECSIGRRREFLTSFVPIAEDPLDDAVATRMVSAARKAGTGPMAAVAGAVAQFVGIGLLKFSPEVIIENGGDIFVRVDFPVVIGVVAGANSLFSGKLGIRIPPTPIPMGVCTSSGTVGPSQSLGRADAAVVISKDVALADAVATAMGNRVQTKKDLDKAVEWAIRVPGVTGALAVCGDAMAAIGHIEIVPLSAE